MTNNEQKSIANHLSEAWLQSEAKFESEFDRIKHEITLPRDGYIVVNLAQVYHDIKLGKIQSQSFDRDKAKQMQHNVFVMANVLWKE